MQETPSPDLSAHWVGITLALTVAALLALALALAVGRIAQRLLSSFRSDDPASDGLTRATVRVVRLVTFGVALAIFAFPALDLAGVELTVGLRPEDLGRWVAEVGIRIAAILTVALVVIRLISTVVDRVQRDLSTGTGPDAMERQKRAQTVAGLMRGALRTLIWTVAALIVLRELDVDITPVLTGAGILGLAVGFGAQTLVKDVISGFFIIVEDQVRVGDVAMVNGVGGAVEEINLRTIVLRDADGAVHVFPNGSVTTLSNLTKDFSFYVVDLRVDYAEDTDRVVQAAIDAAEELRRDSEFAPSILEPLEVMGVDAYGESQVTIKVRIKTVPSKQWSVGREYRRRLKKMFDARNISMPLLQRTLHVGALAEALTPPAGPQSPQKPDDKGHGDHDTAPV